MASRVIQVRIFSPKNILSLLHDAGVFGVAFEEAQADADVLVIDGREFPSLEEAGRVRGTLLIPALIILRNQKELSECLHWLLPGDDICMVRDFRQTGAFRIARLSGDGSGRSAMDVYRKMLLTDALTGLVHRRGGSETLHLWAADSSSDNPLSAIILDLDHFKAVNDNYGHQVGDRVLVEVANILKPHISDEIHVSRFGGEELLILMKADNHRACEFAEFLRKEIENGLSPLDSLEGKEADPVTASFGVATIREPEEGKDLMNAADGFLYMAKSNGRNRVEGLILHENGDVEDEDIMIRDFEARLRVMTDRLVEYLTYRGRKLAGHYRSEADRDGMTGLYRKEYFTRRISREFENARKDGSSLTLLFLDLDDFGNVNRTYGFPTGDSTLKMASRVLLDSIRNVDWTARYGGEELCIIMPSTPLTEAIQVAERVRQKVEALEITAYDGRKFGVTASIGLAEILEQDNEPVDLIQRAGDKTREAKKAGKNTVRY